VKSYPSHVRQNAPLELSSVQSVLEEAAERFGPRPALDFMNKRLTYAEIDALANRAAAGFQKLGVGPGVHVGLFLPNTPHYVIAFFGVLRAGGAVQGVIPEHLMAREVGHKGLTKLHVVHSMHERKALMADLSDAFVASPGGVGTLEEFCEVVTWTQLGLHEKPCGILNVLGFYSPLLAMLDHAVEQLFLKPENRALVLARDSVVELLEALEEWRPVHIEKWLSRETR